ncbi:sugar phosphate isomerase/epimerase family protein [Halorussus sp. AFM4]|uniref:sugar phosphate isomerase/epimerase family protein n=1 Tax=Halorussus sp. AFM4 TaxID=3421651 RepID=UPI003EC0B679
MRPAIQLYTLRDLDEPLPDLLARVGDTQFEGVEFAGLGDADPAEIRDALDDAGLDAAGAHVGAEALEDDLPGVVERYEALGCDRIVVPYLDGSAFESEDAVADTADRLSALADRLDDRGVALGYHNHDHEFVDLGGRSAFEALADATDFDLELDVGWANAAGYDPADLLAEYSDRVPLVHLKDVAGTTPVELGEGDLDVGAAVEAAEDAGTEWLIYEHDEPDDPAASLAHGAETLADLLE